MNPALSQPAAETASPTHLSTMTVDTTTGVVDMSMSPAYSQPTAEPSPKILSPGCLDPNLLIPDTIDTIFHRYYSRKAEIEKMQQDNELQLNQCLTRYGQFLGPADFPAQQVEPVPEYLGFGSQSDHQALPAFQPVPDYHPLSSVGNETHFNDGYNHDEEERTTAYRYPSSPNGNELGIHQDDRGDEANEQALSPTPSSSFNNPFDDDAIDEEVPKTPQLPPPTPPTTNEAGASSEKAATKKRPSKKGTAAAARSAKKPVWYASQLEVANLPTSGLVKKRRRRLGDEVPQPGFSVPSGHVHGIFATGLPVRFVGHGPNPYLAGGGAAVADGSGGEPPVEGERKAKAARMI
ncbi:MAG: hypothetical protein LQ349_004185 [Xanthoria aureola]|nr:MAG: hypothetical protein LQ349_004185 [Xanthoria aureola]